jgi:ATP-binding cassette, subfamily C, bacterial LapB
MTAASSLPLGDIAAGSDDDLIAARRAGRARDRVSSPVAAQPADPELAEPAAAPGADEDPVATLFGHLSRSVWRGQAGGAALAACWCALVAALDRKIRVREVVEALPYRLQSFDLIDFQSAMANLGYEAHPVRLRLAEVERRLLPCLFVPEEAGRPSFERAAVILGASGESGAPQELTLYDGATRSVRALEPEAADAQVPGRAYFFRPLRSERDATSRFIRTSTGHSWFRAVLNRFRGLFWQVFVLGLMLSLVALAAPFFIMLVYDRVIASRSPDTLAVLVVGVVLAIVLEWLLRTVRSRSLAWLAARLDAIVNNAAFERLIGLPPAAIERASVAAQIARIKTFEAVRDFFSGSVLLSFLELPFILVALVALAAIAGPLAAVPVAAIGLYLPVFWLVRHRVKVDMRLAAKAASARQRFALETFEKLEAIRGNGLSSRWAAMYRELSGREGLTNFRLYYLGVVGETLGHAISLLAAVATMAFGVELVRQDVVSTGALVASMILVWRILTPFYSLCSMIPRLEQLRNSVVQVNRLMDLDSEEALGKATARLRQIKGQLTFQNAGFRYAAEQDPIFTDLSFEARPGELVVITGNNGTGKSTVLKLARGLYRPQQGLVRLDGFDLRQLDPREIRRQIGYAPQRPDFFAGTLAQNLCLVSPTADDTAIWKALEQADAAADVAALPDGLRTRLGERQEKALSSSLLVRLSLARSFLQDARLLLLDELPNAVLAGTAGEALKAFLRQQRGQRTAIVVAHRADLLRLADRVVLLRRDQTPMVGPPDKILGLALG